WINAWRRNYCILRVRKSIGNSGTQIDCSVFPKLAAWFSGSRIQSHQAPVPCAEHNSPVVTILALPVSNSAMLEELPLSGVPGLRIKLPKLLSAFRLERDRSEERRV